MKSNDVIANEVLLRAKTSENKKKNRKIIRNSIGMFGLMFSCIAFLFIIIGTETTYHLNTQLSYGTMMYINDNTGIYVVIGVIMFVLGTTLTIVCVKGNFIHMIKEWIV